MDAMRLRTANPDDLVREWNDIIVRTKGQITLPPIDSAATTVPPAVRDQLTELLLASRTQITGTGSIGGSGSFAS